MNSSHDSTIAHQDREAGRPLTRPLAALSRERSGSGTLSPIGGEGWGEGVGFMESLNFISRLTVGNILSAVLLGCLSGLLGPIMSRAADDPKANSPTASAAGFRFEAVNDKSLGLWEGDQPVLVFNHGAIGNPNMPTAQSHSNYLHPIYGVDGEVLTDDFPKDHAYHRGLYWAWPHIKIAGQEYDFWSLRGIRCEFQRWLAQETNSNMAVLGVENGWFVGDKQVMAEKVWIRVQPASSTSRSIDVELTWTSTDQPITLSGAEGKSYGGLTLRFGPRSNTIITVPTGRTTNDLVVARLPWADLSGDLNKGASGLSGAAIFVHPEPGVTPQTFPVGKTFSCRYRLWIHRGAPAAAEIQRAYDGYRATVKLQREGEK
ncbi:MAG: hypothetical protein DME26_21625 [Verrucomicrobia bacterium]|nr:MAG: hypothetical protein DME26_21625 [Verrucomicrobiota bacterium]